MRADYTLYYTTPCWFPLMRPIISHFLSYNQNGSILLSSNAPSSGNHYQAQIPGLYIPYVLPINGHNSLSTEGAPMGRGNGKRKGNDPTERGDFSFHLCNLCVILAEATLEQPQNWIYIKGRDYNVAPTPETILDWDSLACKTASQGSSLMCSHAMFPNLYIFTSSS